MANWYVAFRVKGDKFESLMETLVPFKVEDLEFKVVAGTPKKIRAGDKPAWQIASELADSKPRPAKFFTDALVAAGFKKQGTYSALDQAVRNRTLHKTKVKGVNYFKKGNAK